MVEGIGKQIGPEGSIKPPEGSFQNQREQKQIRHIATDALKPDNLA